MKKIKKFTSRVEVKEVEKEIELPAYFLYGSFKPSESEYGEYFSPIVKISDENERGVCITAGHSYNDTHSFGRSPWDNYRVVSESEFTQTTKEEWDIAVQRVIQDIKK